ncbi:carbohydrate esterase family 4 protein [Mycena rebaudengoi]|nr:carbohydrate esterase family 4 protein [Mycena rebaudengoi]
MASFALLFLPLLATATLDHRHEDYAHSHNIHRALPGTWYHDSDHPVRELFKRAPTDGKTYAAVGSPEWSAPYPNPSNFTLDLSILPAAWTQALQSAIERGVIPDIPVATNVPDQNPVYPTGSDPLGPAICSATYRCKNPGDIWDAPEGTIGVSFDDGPTEFSESLLGFLTQNKQPTTHFLIGTQILYYPKEFLSIFNSGRDIAVHTWTHPHMTTMTNEQLIAEFGYTIRLIHDSTGGKLPRYWRPPYGDSDNRVRAIAKEVFGLTTIIWNTDTFDWKLASTPPATTPAAINASMTTWLTGPKNPGLIILEHETSQASVDAFKSAWPLMKSNNWNVVSLASMIPSGPVYQNVDNSGNVKPMDILLPFVSPTGTPSKSSTSNAPKNTNAAGASTDNGPGGGDNKDSSPDSPQGKGSASTNWRAGPATLFCIAATLMLWT